MWVMNKTYSCKQVNIYWVKYVTWNSRLTYLSAILSAACIPLFSLEEIRSSSWGHLYQLVTSRPITPKTCFKSFQETWGGKGKTFSSLRVGGTRYVPFMGCFFTEIPNMVRFTTKNIPQNVSVFVPGPTFSVGVSRLEVGIPVSSCPKPTWVPHLPVSSRVWVCLKILYSNFLFIHHEAKVGTCIRFYIVKTAIGLLANICVTSCPKCGAFCSAIQANSHPAQQPKIVGSLSDMCEKDGVFQSECKIKGKKS